MIAGAGLDIPNEIASAATDGLGRFRVHYQDDGVEPVEVRATSRAVIEAERRWPGVAPDRSDRYQPMEGVHFIVWYSMGQPYGDFDEWLDKLLVLETLKPTVPDVPPTSPAPGNGS